MMEEIGLKNLSVSSAMSAPGNSNHEMGTARMGHDEKTSVLNKWNQVHAAKNIFITDGSCMTSSNCINPSLTYMALTARAADFAVRALKRGEL
jgi:choline dehydrogenase-like flavoprotein